MKTVRSILTFCFLCAYIQYVSAAQELPECGQDPIVEYLNSDPRLSERLDYSSSEFSERWLVYTECQAENGNAKAQLSMGIVFRDGADGPPQDYQKAREWFLRSAENGNGMAMYNLGQMLLVGRGIDPDHTQAYMWFSLAASFLPQDGSGTRSRAFEYRNQVANGLDSAQLVEAQERSAEMYRQISQAQ